MGKTVKVQYMTDAYDMDLQPGDFVDASHGASREDDDRYGAQHIKYKITRLDHHPDVGELPSLPDCHTMVLFDTKTAVMKTKRKAKRRGWMGRCGSAITQSRRQKRRITCWKRGTISAPCRSCWAIQTYRPPKFTPTY